MNSPPNAIVKILKTCHRKHFRSSFATDADNKEIIFPLKINVGGRDKDFIADNEFVTVTSDYGLWKDQKRTFANEIANTVDDPVYQTEINGLAKYIYVSRMVKHKIKLLFAENYYNIVGKRVLIFISARSCYQRIRYY